MSTGYQDIPTSDTAGPASAAAGGPARRETEAVKLSPRPSSESVQTPAVAPADDAAQKLHIRLFNVKFSPNLGDGLLSECLEAALVRLGAHSDTWSVDLAARRAYGDSLAGRTQILSALDMMPGWLRRQAIRVPLALHARRKWGPHFARQIEGAQAAVIGGGNLISDIDLNFPTKLTLAINEIERIGVPFVVYASGVSSDWTKHGTAMMQKAFSSPLLRAVFVRDHGSKLLWDQKLADASGKEAIVVRDPGLLASEFNPPAQRRERVKPVAGVGIMSHIAIRYHADNAPAPGYLERWYVELIQGLIEKGFHVAVFTNGSPEDIAYLERIRPAIQLLAGNSVSFPVQRTPTELCGIISGLDVLVAYRMHAIIAAYSYGVPAVALAWDHKLKSFMKSVHREEWLSDVTQVDAQAATELACRAVEAGIPDEERKQVLKETWDGVAQLLEVLERAP
jgi:polysaccharide pyruvyl transferase WcaK-like protein